MNKTVCLVVSPDGGFENLSEQMTSHGGSDVHQYGKFQIFRRLRQGLQSQESVSITTGNV